MQNGNPKAQARFQKDYAQLQKDKKAFIIDEATGFVWLMRQK